jgi:amylosucrase
MQMAERVLVLCNFDENPQYVELQTLRERGFSVHRQLIDLYTGMRPTEYEDKIVIQPFHFYWISESY